MTLERPAFPAVFGSTMISSLRSCQQRMRLEFMEHWKPKSDSVHLLAGKAYASGLETARRAYYIEGRSPDEAIALGLAELVHAYGTYACPPESAKSLERMCGALEFHFDQYPLGTDSAIPAIMPDGSRGIEFSFVEPLEVTHPETGDPILYCGRMDMVVDYAGGVFGHDDKTTSQLGPTWAKQWDLRSQFTSYCWGAAKAGIPLQGFLVRGVSILKTKYETQQAVTYRPPWMIDRWYEQTCRDIERLKAAWASGYYDYNLDHACAEFGGCIFRDICLAKDPEPWLEMKFERRVWDPVNREETLL